MRIDVLTIFPEMFGAVLGASIIKRAVERGAVEIGVHNLREWSSDRKHLKVDDRPYGGGPGMVMRPEPFFAAVEALRARHPGETPYVILLSPQGEPLAQPLVARLAERPWLILLCGHYEGVDERVRESLVDAEVSIGDYIVTGGELPAMVVVDAVIRLIPGVLGDAESTRDESFSDTILEYPQYTRPRAYRGLSVPDVLLSGDAQAITVWRELAAWRRTRRRRPDLVSGTPGGCHETPS